MTDASIARPLPSARLASLLLVAVLVLASCAGPSEQTQGLDAMNADRRNNAIAPVTVDGMLQAKAQAWAERLAHENRLYHSTLADGVGGCWRSLGENVGNGGSIADIERAYMASPGHRANILNRTFDRAAVGVAHRGNQVFTVQVFMQSC
jgi:uncharacterized protein YkwD